MKSRELVEMKLASLSFAVRFPTAAGVKLRLTVQLPSGAIARPEQVLDVILKSVGLLPTRVALPSVIGVALILVMVNDCTALV